MDRLPEEILIEILSRLPIKSLIHCRYVCKTWLNLILNPQFAHTHLSQSQSQTNNNNPSLILTHFFHSTIYFLEQTHNGLTLSDLPFSLPNLKRIDLGGSCNGLLCLVHYLFKYNIYVCNPFTTECIKLPEPISPSEKRLVSQIGFGFGFSPKTNEYKVVGIVHNPFKIVMGSSEVILYTLGGDDESWRDMGVVPYVTNPSVSGVFVNLAFHWVCMYPVGLVVSYDIVDEVFGVVPCPEFGVEEGHYSLGVLDGCLSILDSSFVDRVEIWVMGGYGVKESWNKSFSIRFDQVGWNIRYSRILCFQRDGKLLLVYNNEDLLLYDPQTWRLRKLCIDGLPNWFLAVNHVVSLVSPSECLRRDRQL